MNTFNDKSPPPSDMIFSRLHTGHLVLTHLTTIFGLETLFCGELYNTNSQYTTIYFSLIYQHERSLFLTSSIPKRILKEFYINFGN